MLSLLLDTSNVNLLVALGENGKIVDKTEYEAWQRQSEFLVGEIDSILARNGKEPQDVKAVVVAKGPGSYTGVRIALTVAKVMSLALGIPLYLVSSLEVLKAKESVSVSVMNARSKRSYVGVYEGDDCLIQDTIMTNDELLTLLRAPRLASGGRGETLRT